MEQEFPLVSILVLCYNNQQYIYENLKSIFEQTYPNLEVLIGDDASQNFDAEKLIRWINQNRTPNMKRVAIYENKENLGTVANLEYLQEKSQGEYLFQIAADDALFDKNVIQSFYDMAVEQGESAAYITAQTELWDSELKKKKDDFLSADMIELIKHGTARDLFGELSWHPCLPACGFYRRDLMEKIGKLSGTYRLVEDWPWALRMTRMGIKPCYLEIRSSIKHRDGGISHGNSLHSQRTFLTYYHDLLRGYALEVQPYEDMLTREERERAQRYYQDRTRAYYRIHVPKYLDQCKAERREETKTPIPEEPGREDGGGKQNVRVKKDSAIKKGMLREEIKKIVFELSCGSAIFHTFTAGLLCFIAAAQVALPGVWDPFLRILSWCGVVLLVIAAAELIANIWLRIRHFRQRLHE